MGVDGVVCGHIHCAEIRQIGGVTYYNDGDWVESCTALVEDAHGAMSLVHWADEIARQPAHFAAEPENADREKTEA
jgi:UDP-2,3-diacylglucosamine pyrophosphatase LpxH